MKIRVLCIPADEERELEIKDLEGLDPISAIAAENGGFIQIVHTRSLGDRDLVMMVDEDGLLKGLEPNARAMKYSRSANILVGDVYIIGFNLRGINNVTHYSDFPGELTSVKQG